MRLSLLTNLIFASLCLFTVAASASPKIYSGKEAQALRCAQLVFWVASEAERLGYIPRDAQPGIRAYGLYLLDRYTTGTPRQKAAALGKLTRSTDDATSREKFITQHRRCTRQFPF